MRTGKKSITVVLGMHRSGTSAITRGLQILGVDLGERLMPPLEGNNEKGFFEDIDINAINIELLSSLGQDWHTLSLIPADELLHDKYASLRLRAIELLRSRLQDTDHFGFKDPRLCRLLPFWQRVFEHLQLEVSYVIAVRNPLSVAKSLEARNQLPYEKSYYLWLQHILPSVLLTQGMLRVALVDEPLQAEIYFALNFLTDTLAEMLDNLYRDYLLERAESMIGQRENSKAEAETRDRGLLGRQAGSVSGKRESTTIYPRLSLGQTQRFASKGGYITRFASIDSDKLVAESDWLVP